MYSFSCLLYWLFTHSIVYFHNSFSFSCTSNILATPNFLSPILFLLHQAKLGWRASNYADGAPKTTYSKNLWLLVISIAGNQISTSHCKKNIPIPKSSPALKKVPLEWKMDSSTHPQRHNPASTILPLVVELKKQRLSDQKPKQTSAICHNH